MATFCTMRPGCNCSGCRAAGRQALPLALAPRAKDARALAERQWSTTARPRKAQLPCDVGLFSDDAAQLDMVEMFAEPTND